jgi:hypothetical protein
MLRLNLLVGVALATVVSLCACAADAPSDPAPADESAPQESTTESTEASTAENPVAAVPTAEDVGAASIPLCADPAFREQASSMGFIFSTLPVGGAVVGPGFAVAGCANVNEGSIQWRLLDSRGNVVNDGFTQASCGTGCVGDFAFNVDFAMPDGIPPSGTLEVFSTSAEDGSVMHLNAIPVVLTDQLSAASSGPMPGSTSACDDPAFADTGAGMAFIFTSAPAAGTVVRPGFAVSGCANVNEGNVQWQLQDASGNELASGFAQAECGTGCVGAFAFTVDYAPPENAPAPATLRLFSQSMESGAEDFVNAISLIVE